MAVLSVSKLTNSNQRKEDEAIIRKEYRLCCVAIRSAINIIPPVYSLADLYSLIGRKCLSFWFRSY